MNIVASSNQANIEFIVPNDTTLFSFNRSDKVLSLTVDITQPKIPVMVKLVNSVNVKSYNMDVFYENGTTEKFKVS